MDKLNNLSDGWEKYDDINSFEQYVPGKDKVSITPIGNLCLGQAVYEKYFRGVGHATLLFHKGKRIVGVKPLDDRSYAELSFSGCKFQATSIDINDFLRSYGIERPNKKMEYHCVWNKKETMLVFSLNNNIEVAPSSPIIKEPLSGNNLVFKVVVRRCGRLSFKNEVRDRFFGGHKNMGMVPNKKNRTITIYPTSIGKEQLNTGKRKNYWIGKIVNREDGKCCIVSARKSLNYARFVYSKAVSCYWVEWDVIENFGVIRYRNQIKSVRKKEVTSRLPF